MTIKQLYLKRTVESLAMMVNREVFEIFFYFPVDITPLYFNI